MCLPHLWGRVLQAFSVAVPFSRPWASWVQSLTARVGDGWALALTFWGQTLIFFLFLSLSLFFPLSLSLFRATPVPCGGSQARGWIRATGASLCQSHSNARSEPHLPQLTAHGNAGSLTHWARPGIESATSWFLVGFVNHCATTGTPSFSFFNVIYFYVKILDKICKVQMKKSLPLSTVGIWVCFLRMSLFI